MSPSNKIYQIITNSRGRRIIVVNRLINATQISEFEQEQFDAIFINVPHRTYEETRLVMRWLSPTRVGTCFLKPRYANAALKETLRHAADLLDGFCDNPSDENFADFIEDVNRNIERYGIDREITMQINTTSRILANLVKFDISRGRTTFTNYAIQGISLGFSSRYLAMYDNQETLHLDERLKFALKLEELGYAERTRLIDRIHVCHECGSSHQLFVECCPKCSSSDIRQESMIHHFRCANISPETTYYRDGELICPKCRRSLRHIGVDYDRPATVFYCNCGNTFLTSAMKVICTNCLNQVSPADLTPIDVYEYKLTPAGIKAFANDEALFQVESTDIYSGRSTFDNFCESIRLFHSMPSYSDDSMLIFRYHYAYEGDQEDEQVFDVMRTILSNNATVKLTSQGNDFYVMIVVHNNKVEEEHKLAKKSLDHVFLDISDDSDEFNAHWLKTYIYRHSDDPEEFIYQLNEKIEDSVIEDLGLK